MRDTVPRTLFSSAKPRNMFWMSKQKGCSLKSRQLISKGASTLALAGWQQGCGAWHTPLLPVCLPREGDRRHVFLTYAKAGGTDSGQWCALRFVMAEISKIWKPRSTPKQLMASEREERSVCPKFVIISREELWRCRGLDSWCSSLVLCTSDLDQAMWTHTGCFSPVCEQGSVKT